ncbi:MAG: DNA polymerase III subunit gamma/tau [Chloroflexi bacterium]|nr:DNA polymerase III subunit gamma/tau [Chloroflexota bacterium]
MGYNICTMTSQVFYRKWRPQTFNEIAGQEHVVQTLRNAIKSSRIAHAYLFCGPRGSGKTSTARILAKAVNCRQPVEGEPCNSCDSCLAINHGNALDIIEIDEASNRGIDDMNGLKERVNYSPNILKFKVYIIDEVHMITREGANAFLKTLEEPPPHVIFILATTDPHKIISTITSRCQRFDFHRLSSASVIARLSHICEKEGIKIDPEALKLVAKVTTGSLRDATNLLEQLITYYGNTIEMAQALAMLGISGDLRIRELARHIVAMDVSSGLKVINAVAGEGLDLRQFNRELVDYLRQLLLAKSGSADTIDATSDDLAEMQKIAGGTSLDYLLNTIKLFSGVDLRMDTYSPLPLELALVESVISQHAREKSASDPSSGKDWQSSRTAAAAPRVARSTEPARPAGLAGKSLKAAGTPTLDPAQLAQTGHSSTPFPDSPRITEPLKMDDPGDLPYLKVHWKDFINSMRGEGSGGNLDARLRHACEPVEIKGDNLVLGFYHEFHKKYIDDRKYLHLIEKKLKEVFGHNYTVTCVMMSQEQKSELKPASSNHLVEAALSLGAKIVEEKAETEVT